MTITLSTVLDWLLTPTHVILLVVLYFLGLVLYNIFLRPAFSPMKNLPGPPRESWIMGNFKAIMDAEPGRQHMKWLEEYGPGVMRYTMQYGDRVVITDPAALNHILLTHSYQFPKPNDVRNSLSRILGKGLLFAEGDDHKRQKKIMTPAFSPSHIKALTPTFFEMSYRLREKLMDLVNSSTIEENTFGSGEAQAAYTSSRTTDEPQAIVEVSKWLSRVTLDIIGLTGFGTDFNAIEGNKSVLGDAFAGMLTPSTKKPTPTKMLIFMAVNRIIPHIPFFQYLPIKRLRAIREGFAALEKECITLIEQKKKEVLSGEFAGVVGGGKDLISLLLKSNLAATDPKLKMSDEEMQGQVTTFLLAGHETTATALTWTLWILACHQAAQTKLRAEIQAALAKASEDGRDELTYEELNALEYLDAVTREMLRMEPPASGTVRISTQDTVIPLSSPITLKTGETATSFFMPKDTTIFLSTFAANMNASIFGDDVMEFRPERWLDGKVGEKIQGVGVFSHLLTFLAGPRACIGYKFSLVELKAILVVLIGEFVFHQRDEDGPAIERRSTLVTRSVVVGEEELGFRMPLRVSKASKV